MGDDLSPRRGKFKFKPKAPPRKITNPVEPKSETPESADEVLSGELLKLVKQSEKERGNRKDRVEKKVAPVRVSFGYDQTSSRSRQMRYGATSGFKHPSKSSKSTTDDGEMETAAVGKCEEPFNYQSYYPTRLPLRRPYSGDPELLDESEFGEASASNLYDEHSINAAAELGLMNEGRTDGEEGGKRQMFFFQLPATLPLLKRFTTADSNEGDGSNTKSQTTCSLADHLHAGFLGKMLIYEDGTIKMKMGDMLFDVSSSSECIFAQDVCVVDTEGKQFCNLGQLTKRAIVTPDIDSMLGLKIQDS